VNKISFSQNVYTALLKFWLLAMGGMMVARLLFLAFNFSTFPDLDFGHTLRLLAGGLRFDLTAVLYLNSLVILMLLVPLKIRFLSGYQSIVRWVFIVVNAIGLALNVIDFFYFRFTDRRTTFDVFNQFENEQNISELVVSFAFDYLFGLYWLAYWFSFQKKLPIQDLRLNIQLPFTFRVLPFCQLQFILLLPVCGVVLRIAQGRSLLAMPENM
jgi:hypothetical protein